MHRISPRVCTPIRAFLTDDHGKEYPISVVNIGLNGAYIRQFENSTLDLLAPGSAVNMEVPINHGEQLIVQGEVIRRDRAGVALHFAAIGPEDQKKLWTYMRDQLVQDSTCPYCNEPLNARTEDCPRCRFNLKFELDGYFEYWETESLQRRMQKMLQEIQNPEKLRKACRYFEEEIFQKRPAAVQEEVEEFVGVCEAMKAIFSLIRKVAMTDLPVLILGESGTGKELTARAIHERSERSDKPLIALNCAAIPESLIESELFGHEKGAFTGAHQSRRGKIEQASSGTLFLDEIGELPLHLQPKLLRFLEDQTIDRIGSGRSIQVDVRIIAATNRDLEKDVAQGRFRADLYHRLRVFPIMLPPLRDRGEDKVILAQYFLKKVKSERDWNCKGFSKEALDAIRSHSWPGNVREMINKIRRAIVVQEDWILPQDLELEVGKPQKAECKYKDRNDQLKKNQVQSALKENSYNATRTAASLGISRTYLYVLCRKFDIPLSSRVLKRPRAAGGRET